MNAQRVMFIAVILILQQSLSAQVSNSPDPAALRSSLNSDSKLALTSSEINFSLKYNPVFSNPFTDTLRSNLFEKNTIQDTIPQHRWLKASIVPAALIISGTITLLPAKHCLLSKYTIHDKVLDLFSGYTTTADNYLQFAPLGAVFALKAAGVKSRSDFVNQAVITAKAELVMNLVVRGMKTWIHSERPTASGENSMPSGHTAQAFLSATILDMEYRDTSPWISVGGYVTATTTGILRMANNQHWISDVLIGAGIGIFSVKAVYLTHQYRWGKKNNIVILPAIYKNGGGVSFAMQL